MANFSNIEFKGVNYPLKDSDAREDINALQTSVGELDERVTELEGEVPSGATETLTLVDTRGKDVNVYIDNGIVSSVERVKSVEIVDVTYEQTKGPGIDTLKSWKFRDDLSVPVLNVTIFGNYSGMEEFGDGNTHTGIIMIHYSDGSFDTCNVEIGDEGAQSFYISPWNVDISHEQPGYVTLSYRLYNSFEIREW